MLVVHPYFWTSIHPPSILLTHPKETLIRIFISLFIIDLCATCRHDSLPSPPHAAPPDPAISLVSLACSHPFCPYCLPRRSEKTTSEPHLSVSSPGSRPNPNFITGSLFRSFYLFIVFDGEYNSCMQGQLTRNISLENTMTVCVMKWRHNNSAWTPSLCTNTAQNKHTHTRRHTRALSSLITRVRCISCLNARSLVGVSATMECVSVTVISLTLTLSLSLSLSLSQWSIRFLPAYFPHSIMSYHTPPFHGSTNPNPSLALVLSFSSFSFCSCAVHCSQLMETFFFFFPGGTQCNGEGRRGILFFFVHPRG